MDAMEDGGRTKREDALAAALRNDEELNRSALAKEIVPLVSFSVSENLDQKKAARALSNAMLGLAAEFKDIFGEFPCEKTKVSLGKEEELEVLKTACPDDCVELLDALCGVYSAFVLQGLLSYAPGKTISENMVAKYDRYAADLRMLKELVHDYCSKEAFEAFFRGPTYHDLDEADLSGEYSRDKAQGYTAYNLHKLDYEGFKKEVKDLFAETGVEDDERHGDMMARFEKQQFLRRLKTSDNGAIYYQLHLEELSRIVQNQGRFYPFLAENADKFESLVSFRIPYYVGPLTAKNARQDAHGKNRFQWSERKSGMEGTVVTPWNWEQVIDKNKSAENFIMRMTGDCSYLVGEKTLPRCSLLYEEFCVLNELNGMRWSEDGDDWHRFDAAQREGIVCDLFHRYRRVTCKKIADWLVREDRAKNPRVKGEQGELALESKLSSFIFFTKDVLHVDDIAFGTELYRDVETIILWSTLFEDRSILAEKLESEFGPDGSGLLDTAQIKAICKKRLTGWGRLSERFLTGLKVDAQDGRRVSIMDVLREGNPNTTRRSGETMVMMEALRDEALGFQKAVDAENRAYYVEHGRELGVNDLPGSPAIRRSLNQAIRIVDEIAKIAGHAPANIFIEVTHDEDERNKGKRTKRRYDQIKAALEAFKNDDPKIWEEIQATAPADLDERLTLYFMQRGKCLYSGRPIDINQISNAGLYEVDHIIPRAHIKDDSFENKALVYREENQKKTDQLLLDSSIRRKMGKYWHDLHEAGLIGDKKFNNLMRSHISEGAMKGFVARQLVETSQMVKLAQSLLEVRYAEEDTKIVPVKASMSHNLREAAGFVKCREANDFHHAHDAFLACRIGLFIQMRFPGIYDNPIRYTRAMQKYVRSEANQFNRAHQMPGSAGFIVSSFMVSGFDKETGEIFRDTWDAEAELEGIRRALNYRQCYISRMPQEDTGAFWNATIYSPRVSKKGLKPAFPVKQGLDPKRFGGFSNQEFAYFFIYEAEKKGESCFQFAGVPVWLAEKIGAHPDSLAEYAYRLASESKLEFVRIVRSKIMKKQLIDLNDEKLIVTGAEEVRNANQLYVECKYYPMINEAVSFIESKGDSQLSDRFDGDIASLFQVLTLRGLRVAGGLMAKIPQILDNTRICSLAAEGKAALLIQFLKIVNGVDRKIDLSRIEGAKTAGQYKLNFNKVLNDPGINFCIIDQSVTGMFERKTRVGL